MKIYKINLPLKIPKTSIILTIFYIIIILCLTFNATYYDYKFKTIRKIFSQILCVLANSFFMASIFLGLITNKFAQKYVNRKYGILKSILFPSLIFGMIHITCIFSNYDIFMALIITLHATTLGILYTTIYFKSNNIYITIIIKTIIDISGNFNFLFLNREEPNEFITIEILLKSCTIYDIIAIIVTYIITILSFLAFFKKSLNPQIILDKNHYHKI